MKLLTFFYKYHLRLALVVAALVLYSLDSLASDTKIDTEPANYAFSNYLGSGLYHTSGQQASVFNIPFSYQLESESGIPFRVRLPVSVGFFDFDVSGIPDGAVPESIDTISFVPGIEFDYPINNRINVTPYFDLGAARNLSNQTDTAIYSSGISLYYKLDGGEYDPLWVNRMYYAGHYTDDTAKREEYAAFQTGIDVGLPYTFNLAGLSIQPTMFATTYWYFLALEFDAPGGRDVSVSNSYELGLTLKSEKKLGYSFLSIDRVGVGYRFGDNFYAWHLLFDLPI
ncbi:hypothetical protein [Alkalimarinus alittae]|uniref:Transporter n=1 Tax=Alkalimarinus alittae TaxID=2961619 RepID=A0ABY6N312_9ALTE|nr:hypothetical protein [Alkalimarinus alittae]UZE96486.1 hypothetical protein NKI27_01685 [Alkalimarinus alittae]